MCPCPFFEVKPPGATPGPPASSGRGAAAIGTSVFPSWPRPSRAPTALRYAPQLFTHSGAIPELACAKTRTAARREAAETCVGQRWSRSSLEGILLCSRTGLPRLIGHNDRAAHGTPSDLSRSTVYLAFELGPRPQRRLFYGTDGPVTAAACAVFLVVPRWPLRGSGITKRCFLVSSRHWNKEGGICLLLAGLLLSEGLQCRGHEKKRANSVRVQGSTEEVSQERPPLAKALARSMRRGSFPGGHHGQPHAGDRRSLIVAPRAPCTTGDRQFGAAVAGA